MFPIFENIFTFLAIILPLLISIAFFTLYERQILAALQRRQGPNVVGFYGLLQPFADGMKFLLKESILPKSSNLIIFLFAPVFTFALAMAGWAVIPLAEGAALSDFRLGLLYLFAISSLSVHSVIMAGWSSNSKYAFLGGLRSAAQMISYEVSLGATLLSVYLLSGRLNLRSIMESQDKMWFALPLLPTFVLFFIRSLAETNRHPFDLPEAEAELVSGYNVEYSALGFALFFLAEYGNIILMSVLSALFFLGGFISPIIFAIKALIFITLFIVVRGRLPRYRYDQLMRLGWKVFLPFSLAMLLFVGAMQLSFNGAPYLLRALFVLIKLNTMQFYLDLGSSLLFIGARGVLINRKNILLSIIAIELMLYGLNYYLGRVATYVNDISGLGFSLFVLTLAAAESALALGILMDYFRVFTDILIRLE